MEVIDKKSYTLYPLTSYTAGANRRDLYEEVPSILKAHVESTIPFPDQEFEVMQSEKFNIYELDELPTDQELLFDTKDELIAKLEEWGFEWDDFAKKICYFPYNSNENVPTSNRFARGWVKDISPVWSAWENLGIGKSWRATSGTNITLTMDDQYYGKASDLITYPMEQANSIRNIYIRKPLINVFALSNKPLEETKHIWTREFMLKTDAETPGAEDVFSSYLTASTIPEFGSSRTGTGSGNRVAGYNTGLTASIERGNAGFAIPILFYVNNPGITNVNKIYGLIYFGYVQRNYDGTVSNQKYFIMSKAFAASINSYDWYYMKNSNAYADINDATAKIDEFFGEASEWTDEDIDIEETDPYETIQESELGGGDGTLDWTSDEIEPTPDSPVNIPGLLEPTSSGGLINLYRVDGVLQDDTEWLRYFRDFLFDDGLLSAMEKTNADIKSCIVSLKALPYSVECTQNAYKVILGKYDNSTWVPTVGAAVEAKKVTKQTQTLNLGSIEIKKFYGSYLDYAPHTKVQIFLPFIGVKELDTDEVMGKTLTLKYVCDNFTGLFTAHIYVDGQDLYNFNGSMAMELPISGIEYTNKLSGLLQTIGGAATTIGGVATAASGNPLGIAAAIGGIGAMAQGAAGYNQGSVYKTSNLGLDWGWLGCRQPHLIISSPRLAQPRHRNGITGKATCRTVKVSNLSGYNKFADIHVDQVVCSDTEKELIKKALMGGFIV